MQPYFMACLWIVLAIVMVFAEIATVQLVSVWFVVGALCAALTTIFTDSVVIQLVVFCGVSLVSLIVTRPLVKKLKKNIHPLASGAKQLIGKPGVMLTDLNTGLEVGQAKVSGNVWSVKCIDPPLAAGDNVRVLAIDGVKLIVEKLKGEER